VPRLAPPLPNACVPQNLRLYREAAAVLMDAGDHAGLIRACERFGDARTGGNMLHFVCLQS
jgi:hypothetical protein